MIKRRSLKGTDTKASLLILPSGLDEEIWDLARENNMSKLFAIQLLLEESMERHRDNPKLDLSDWEEVK